jgi:ParB family chromosome partitioning protein
MHQDNRPAIHTLLGRNNVLVILPHAQRENATQDISPLAILGRTLSENLHCYTVINSKYKPTIMDMNDVRAMRKRKKIANDFLGRIKEFKEEISENDLLPLILILQTGEAAAHQQADIIFGYGQGERSRDDRPHRPTIAPSFLSKIRIAAEDQGISTALADTASDVCGRESYSLNQLFRQKDYMDGFYDPTVRSITLTIAADRLTGSRKAAQTAIQLAEVFSDFAEPMPLVRRIAMNAIDTSRPQDLRFIFRVYGDNQYNDMIREAYIDELAGSIERNGLLHPLVLLQKMDGRYKILCGFRRFQALHRLGRQWVEAKTYNEKDFTTEDFFNISLAENTKRRNLNPVEIGNFLESASRELNLNNARLADRFGESLGMGLPGKKVSQSTIHKYRKLYQIRERGESAEMISDVINDKLQFTIAAEVLAPIKEPADRDSLYLEIIKPLAPTRPQLLQITKLLSTFHPQTGKAIATLPVKSALEKAVKSKQKASTFLRILKQSKKNQPLEKEKAFTETVDALRKDIFGNKATRQDFDISRTGKNQKKAVTLHIRLKRQSIDQTITSLKTLLDDKKRLGELRKLFH